MEKFGLCQEEEETSPGSPGVQASWVIQRKGDTHLEGGSLHLPRAVMSSGAISRPTSTSALCSNTPWSSWEQDGLHIPCVSHPIAAHDVAKHGP